ncbi:MAG: LPS-assembly protein [Halioglobus sp.]|jgi:LPS-assembly protein
MIPLLPHYSDNSPLRSRWSSLLLTAMVAAAPAWAQDPIATEVEDPNQILETIPIKRGPLDWVSLNSVPRELRDETCISCKGRYIDPLSLVDQSVKPEASDIEASASETTLKGDNITLSGGVEVNQGYRQLRGDNATFNRNKRTGTISGDISVREPGVLFRGDHAEFNSISGEAKIDGSEFVLHDMHFHGSAEELRRDEDGLIHLLDSNLSYCEPDDKDWNLRADNMVLDVDKGYATARGAKIELGGIPVFYAPWIRLPLDDRRSTGILWPSLGSDSKGGIDVSLPVYLNLAPNYDALYSPRYIQERGLNHDLEVRYLHELLGAWSVGGSYLSDDKRYADEFPEDRNTDRWLSVVAHDGLFQQRWRSKVEYAKASDVNYLKDLDNSSLETKRQTNLLQLASLDYLGDDWLVEMELQQFQTLADDLSNDYKKLPQITGRYRSQRVPFEFDPILLAQYSDFDTDDDRVRGQRVYAEVGAGYPMQWGYGFFNPVLKYRQLNYDLTDLTQFADENKPSAGSALASIDGGLFFERQTVLANKSIVHTLEPRLYYVHSEYEDQTDQPDFDSAELTFSYNQLFRETRFSGRDRIDDADQVSLGVTTRFIGDTDGQEYLSASVGQIFYFKDRRVRLNALDEPEEQSGSEMAAELRFRPNSRLGMRSNLLWDPYSGEVNAGSLQANYAWEDGSVLNAGYTYRRPGSGLALTTVTEQFHLSTYLPVTDRWRFFAAWNYSVEADTSIEDMYGLEYDTCCWKVRVLHLRYFDNVSGALTDFNNPDLERESSTQVQIVLKGMGGFGNRVTGILQDMIRGFEDREY